MFWIIFAFIISSKCLVLALYAWRHKEVPVAPTFMTFSLLLALWAAGYAMELLSSDMAAKVWWAKVEYIGIASLPVMWLVLILKYAQRTRWLNARVFALLAVVPTLTLLSIWTNEAHNLFWRSIALRAWGGITLLEMRYGPLFWLHTIYSYALLLAGIGLLVWMFTGSLYLHRKQTLSLLVGGCTLLAFNLAYLFFPHLPLDLSPYSFGVGMIALASGFFYFYVPDPLPSARAVVIENMTDSVIVLDEQARVVDLNRAAQALLEVPVTQALNQPLSAALPSWTELGTWLSGAKSDEPQEVSVKVDAKTRHYHLHTSPLHERGHLSGRVLVIQDVTEQRTRQSDAERLAYSDALTGLSNRRSLLERGEALLDGAKGKSATFFYLDLNRFKTVNDTLGHSAGDEVLVQAAERLKSVIQADDLLARLDGDEFALLCLGLSEGEAQGLAARILAALRRPFSLQGHTFHVDSSLGIAVYPRNADTIDDLLKCADIAMYGVKKGHATSFFYSDSQGAKRRDLLVLEERLRGAIRDASQRTQSNQLYLCYQSISSLQTGRVVGAEALLRWQDDMGEVSAPATFIPFAEELGLIREIDEWVLAEVVEDLGRLAGVMPPWVSVNVSPRSFRERDFASHLSKLLDKGQVGEGTLMLEITERAFMDPTSSLDTLLELKAMGVCIAVDDFGTGYSSLSYLERLPIDMLKIDKSFVWGIEKSSAKEAIVRTIITLAHNLGVSVIAEGVETDAQRRWLRAEGCDLAQGYLLGRPASPQRLLKHG